MVVEPAPGALVRDPATKLAVQASTEVDPHDPYWARALADGDVLPMAPTDPAPVRAAQRKEAR